MILPVGSTSGAQDRAPGAVRCRTATSADPARCTLAALQVERAAETPALDGRLDEPVRQRAVAATDFTQFDPVPGDPASELTEARVRVTSDAVYVGMRLRDTHPDSIRAQFVRRDVAGAGSDWAHVFIDSYFDRRTAF